MRFRTERQPSETPEESKTAAAALREIVAANPDIKSFTVNVYVPGSGGVGRPEKYNKTYRIPAARMRRFDQIVAAASTKKAVELDPLVKKKDGTNAVLFMLDLDETTAAGVTMEEVEERLRQAGLNGWIFESSPGHYAFFLSKILMTPEDGLMTLGKIVEMFMPEEYQENPTMQEMVAQLKTGKHLTEETAKDVLRQVPRRSERKPSDPVCVLDLRGVAAQSLAPERRGPARGLFGMRISASGQERHKKAPCVVKEI